MTFRERIRARARGLGARIALAEGQDPRVRQAAAMLEELGIARTLVVGGDGIQPARDDRLPHVANLIRGRRPEKVNDSVHALDLAADPLRFTAGLVALGEADAAVGGAVATTADVIRAALWLIGTAPSVGFLSSAFYMGLPDGSVLTFTDCAVMVDPDADQLARMAITACRDRTLLVGDEPRVAFLSYSTKRSAEGPEPEKMREAADIFLTTSRTAIGDGEMQVDAALVPEVGARKAPSSSLRGDANILVFPNLGAGNIAYKLVQRLAGATAAGPLFQGLARPMSDLSRGATADDIVDVAAMVALQARADALDID